MAMQLGKEEWQRIAPYLDQALEMASERRSTWLEELERSEPDTAAALRTMLMDLDALNEAGFLDGAVAEPRREPSLIGQRIGAYEIESLLGYGGMGTVWLAGRHDGRYEGRVAIKLLNLALVGHPAEQRFRREGAVLARLQHPNIARLIDAGVTDQGQPYLILEHIEGLPIDLYCRDNGLDVDTQLRLFLYVLAAVTEAHRHLIVHRDLKPSNILITAEGVPKLLDFGVAALLAPETDLSVTPGLTREIGAAMTPEFAAPEQIAGQIMTTATDVYSLGVVLCTLLAGRHPRPAARANAANWLRDVLEHALPLASEVAASDTLKRRLRGDLDDIIAKATNIDPQQRYATVASLEDDLSRHLANEPVSARPGSARYRAAKFLRRHRAAVTSTALGGIALIGVTVFALWQMVDANRQRDIAEHQRQLAQGFNTTISSILSQAGPGGRALMADELLERAVDQVIATNVDNPEFVVDMLSLLSGRFYDLGNTERELETLRKAAEVARTANVPLLVVRVDCDVIETYLNNGQKDEAERHLAEVLQLMPSVGELSPSSLAACLRAEAEVARTNDDFDTALARLNKARRILEDADLTSSNVYSGLLSVISRDLVESGDSAAAHTVLQNLVALDERLGRADSVPGRNNRMSLAIDFYNFGQIKKSLNMMLDVTANSTDEDGQMPSEFDNLTIGVTLSRLGRNGEALPMLQEAITAFDQNGFLETAIIARLAYARALLESDQGDAARIVVDETAAMADSGGFTSRSIQIRIGQIEADMHLAAGKTEAAEAAIAPLVAYFSGGVMQPDLRLGRLLLTEARIGLARGEPGKAQVSATKAIELFENATPEPEKSAFAGEAWMVLAEAQLAAGQSPAASLAKALPALENGLGADHALAHQAKRFVSPQ